MKKKLRIGFIFAIVGLIGGIFVGLYQLNTLSEEMIEEVIGQLGSIEMLIVISGIQSALFAFISTILGLIFMEKLGFRLHTKFSKYSLILALGVGTISALFIVLSDRFIFQSLIGSSDDYQISIYYLLGGILYGGVVEELLLRLFVMSGLILLISKFVLKNKTDDTLKPWVIWTAIIVSALLFGALHLPATSVMFDLSLGIILRALLLNGLPGIAFGYLYWKHGLSHAMIAHMFAHVVMQLILMPIFY